MDAEQLLERAREWVKFDPNTQTSSEIQGLIDIKDGVALAKVLGSRLAFGTAGLRGPMGGGYNRMNDLVILQTAQGLSRYLLKVVGDAAKDAGLVIGYDHRRFGSLSSLDFARMTAAVFLSQGFRVYLLEGFVATPLVAYGVRKLGCCCGVMVTASHNPKRDNGFKVYWGNGSQIIPPHDAGIAAAIEANLAPWQESYDCSGVTAHALAKYVTDEIATAYYEDIVKLIPAGAASGGVRIAYTAMHGVGRKWLERAFLAAGLDTLSIVPSQAEPDPEFPTVVFPNPEEKGALDEAMKWADAQGCPIIIANDPDADRLAAAERTTGQETADAAGKGWRVFSGNEIGTLLGHWAMAQYKKKSVSISPAAEAAVLASVVSSRMLGIIAKAEGITYYDTLTGFKWLGNKAADLQAAGVRVLFSYEEALGYCCGDVVNDKDGISAGIVFASMTQDLYAQGSTLQQHLADIYGRYGRVVSLNSYVFCHDPALTDSIFARIRGLCGVACFKGAGEAGLVVSGSRVTRIVDVTLGLDTAAASGLSDLPVTSDSHMIMFAFANGVSLTLRTSGTEPKIKFYTEIAGQPASASSGASGAAAGEEAATLTETLNAFVSAAVEELLQPTLHGLASP